MKWRDDYDYEADKLIETAPAPAPKKDPPVGLRHGGVMFKPGRIVVDPLGRHVEVVRVERASGDTIAPWVEVRLPGSYGMTARYSPTMLTALDDDDDVDRGRLGGATRTGGAR